MEQFWKSVGARVLRLDPDLHDELVSRSSHLPHIIAATLAASVLNPKHPNTQAALCANGFRDVTRIASGSPEMWRDIALANRRQIRAALDQFVRELQGVQALLRAGDAAGLTRFFETAKRRRDQWSAGCVSNPPE